MRTLRKFFAAFGKRVLIPERPDVILRPLPRLVPRKDLDERTVEMVPMLDYAELSGDTIRDVESSFDPIDVRAVDAVWPPTDGTPEEQP